ncbi:MAG TPA: apolipoprotein N-acyltransferase [Myxococcota bacterium]|nr:apolipoprotein N-acyltransferase [Myxococcota bacterium]
MPALSLPRLLGAIGSALLLVVISPPDNLHYLHWFAFLPLLWALRPGDTRGNVVLSYLCGFVAVHSLFFWLTESIVRFSNIPAYAAIQIVVAYAFASGFWYAIVFGLVQPLRKHLGVAWVFLVPAVEVAIEVLQFSLFPYYHGVSQYRTPLTWQLASVTGVMGVSYLIFLTNCALAEVVYRRAEGRGMPWATLGVTAALFVANLGYGAWRIPRVEAEVATWPTIKVTQLQQGISMEERMKGSARDAMLSWVRMTGELVGEDVDLVIWPEGATPYDPRAARVGQLMTNLVGNIRAPIVFGGGFAEGKVDPVTGRKYVEQRNSIYLITADGQITQRYDKMVPLPFGEYLPFADTFPFLKEIIRGPGDFEAGSEPVFFAVDGIDGTFTTPICYEAILQDFVHQNLAETSLFVNVTNDGWFGDTQAPHQHAMLSAVRAVENGVPMVRIAYTGVSMHVSPTGEITNETEPFTEVIRIVETPIGRVDTVYRHIGDTFAWLCVLASFCGLFQAHVRSRRAGSVTHQQSSS